MKAKKFSLTAFISENTFPVLLLTALFSSVIYIYTLGNGLILTGCILFSFIYSSVLFLTLDFLKRLNKGWISTLAMFFLLFGSLIIGSSFIETGFRDTAQWFFEPDAFAQVYTGNIISIILMFGFVLGSALYYFTQVRFRSIFVFLICLCPFSLFAKSFTDIPVIFTIIIITLFFLLIISKQTEGKLFCGKNRYAAIGAFIVIVSAGAAFLPKLEFAPYREEFDEAITGIRVVPGGAMNFNDFSDSSSNTGSSENDEILFTFYGDNPGLIKRQCFNYYNSSTNLWEYYGEIDTGYNYYDEYIRWEDPAMLAAECGIEMQTTEKFVIISSEKGYLKALYTPENFTSIVFGLSSLSDYSYRYVYRTPVDEYFVSADTEKYDSYSVNWIDTEIDVEFMLFYDDERAEAIGGSYAEDYLLTKKQMKEYHDPLMTEEARIASYKNKSNYERVRELAEEITQGCANDYEKAYAIEQYFKTDKFVYDDAFVVSDASVENFLFNTRRGICSDYATAMTLMCREAGLYSRYVEGFLVQKADGADQYTVTAADSHAYVQVWLDGYGWTDFDPTSSNIDGGYVDPTFYIVGIIMVLIVIGGIVFFVIRPVVAERSFVRKTGNLSGREQLMKLYPRISSVIHKELHLRQNILTIREIKESAFDKFSLDISEVADDYEATVYGDIDCGSKNYINYYTDLKKAVKQKRAEERKNKHIKRVK